MRGGGGVQATVLASLGVVVLGAVLVLTAVVAAHEEARLRELLGPALLAEARALAPARPGVVPGTDWWRLGAEGRARARGPVSAPIDAASRELARRARREDAPLLRPGAPWQAIRFAAPVGSGEAVVVGRLPVGASLRLRAGPMAVIAGIALADVALFGVFGGALLRRRVVRPFQALARGARAVAAGESETRVAEEGPREAAETARAFNAMTAALARRSEELEKAVADLRRTNRELRETRSGLDRAEHLAAVGRLAAGVAHEVGNPIGALLAYVDLAKRDRGLGEEARSYLERAAREGGRVRRILQQLLDFSRPARGAPGPSDLGAVAEDARALVAVQRPYAAIDFEIAREGAPPAAAAGPEAVSPVLLNLLLNAADAVQGREAPRVHVAVRPAALAVRAGEAPGGGSERRAPDAVECVVADNGAGIPPEDRERIFEPFYTTKPPGAGTGLGLANAARVAEELGGSLALAEPPEGFRTAFALRLPSSPPAGPAAGAPRLRGEGA